MAELTQEELRRVLHYAPETGIWTRIACSRRRDLLGEPIGDRLANTYITVECDGKAYKAHHLAWFWMMGGWPEHRVGHINGNRSDNRWCNLALLTPADRSAELVHGELLRLLHYDPDTGIFTRKATTKGRKGCRVGERVGTSACRKGDIPVTRRVTIGRRRYMEHRLAWFYMTGAWPEHEVDHVNGDPFDNRWANLRAANHQQNHYNRGKNRNNKSGYKGVSWHRGAQKWVAQIRANNEVTYLGLFTDPAAAALAYRKAELEAFGRFTRGIPQPLSTMGGNSVERCDECTRPQSE